MQYSKNPKELSELLDEQIKEIQDKIDYFREDIESVVEELHGNEVALSAVKKTIEHTEKVFEMYAVRTNYIGTFCLYLKHASKSVEARFNRKLLDEIIEGFESVSVHNEKNKQALQAILLPVDVSLEELKETIDEIEKKHGKSDINA